MTDRRAFLTRMGAAAAALALEPGELRAAPLEASSSWDTSWLDRLATAQYRVVFNASELNDGEVFGYVDTFFAHYHEVHATTDEQTRPVVVIRRLGTSLGFNDAMWDKYALGAANKVNDPVTRGPARRNIYWSAGSSSTPTIESLSKRGMISLVCNVALGNVGRRLAEQNNQPVAAVQNELRANLVPGAILVPSGIYALIRAQNAGCAWMPGT